MLDAFRVLGHEVDVIAGYSIERKKAIKLIKNKIKSGTKYDFLYSESSTMPTILTDPHHLPLSPLLDFNFFKFCKKNNIKIGLFYRDIYWMFSNYDKNLNLLKKNVAKFSYKYELYFYKYLLTKLYLPSLEMGEYVPIVNPKLFSSLPPGHDIGNISDLKKQPKTHLNKLKVFYVGGMSDNYQMHTLIDVINNRDDVEFTLCTRASEWAAVKKEYPALSNNIKVVHENGAQMQVLMNASDVVSIFLKPQEYSAFAAPVKLYEYLGNRKPIIASQGMLAGKFVSDNKIGWSLPYDASSLNNLLTELNNSPEQLNTVQQYMNNVALEHTWQARAKQVIKDLT